MPAESPTILTKDETLVFQRFLQAIEKKLLSTFVNFVINVLSCQRFSSRRVPFYYFIENQLKTVFTKLLSVRFQHTRCSQLISKYLHKSVLVNSIPKKNLCNQVFTYKFA